LWVDGCLPFAGGSLFADCRRNMLSTGGTVRAAVDTTGEYG